MVAGMTADVFVQLTATLAHLSSTLNKTGKLGPRGNYVPTSHMDSNRIGKNTSLLL